MASTTITVGEQVYDYTVDVVKVIEFCSNMTDILAGNAPVPLEGARRTFSSKGP